MKFCLYKQRSMSDCLYFFLIQRLMPEEKTNISGAKGMVEISFLINEVSRVVNLSQKRIREYKKRGSLSLTGEEHQQPVYSNFDVGADRPRSNSLIHDRASPCLPAQLMVLAPCWNIYDCDKKEECPAFSSPGPTRYEWREYRGTLCEGPWLPVRPSIATATSKEKRSGKTPF